MGDGQRQPRPVWVTHTLLSAGSWEFAGGTSASAPLHRVMDKGSAVCLSPPALVSLGFQVQLLVKESYGVRVEALSPEPNTS